MVLFLWVLGCDMIARWTWMVDDTLKSGDENLYAGEFWTCHLAISERLRFCWRIQICNVWMLVRNLLLATWCLGIFESNLVSPVDAPPALYQRSGCMKDALGYTPTGEDEMRWNEIMSCCVLCYHVMSARVVYGLATWPYPKSEICRYVFTPMLFGLRWPGQTVGSWPPADTDSGLSTHTDIHTQRCGELINDPNTSMDWLVV